MNLSLTLIGIFVCIVFSQEEENRLRQLRKAVNCVLDTLFPEATEETKSILLEKSFSTTQDTDRLQEELVSAFNASKDKRLKQYIGTKIYIDGRACFF